MNFTIRPSLPDISISRTACVLMIMLLLLMAGRSYSNQVNLDSLLSPEEMGWLLANKDNITFSSDPSFPPADYIENGEHKGYISEYIRMFEDHLGLKFKRTEYPNWAGVLNGLENSEIDFTAGIHKTEERDRLFLFSDSVIKAEVGILVNKKLTGKLTPELINTLKLACVKGYASTDYIRQAFPDAVIILTDDYAEAVIGTSYGLADGVVIDFISAGYLLEKFGITNLRYGTTLDFEWILRFAFRNDLPEFKSIINKLLSTVSQEQQKEIFNKWVDVRIQEAGFFEANRKIIFAVTCILLVLAFAVMLFIYSLRKQVRKKTLDLKKAIDLAKENEEKYRLIAENTTDVVWLTDLDFRLKYISPSVERMFGWDVDEYYKLNLEDKYPRQYLEKARILLRKELEIEKDPHCDKERSRVLELEHYVKDGSTMWITMNISLVRDHAGTVTGLHGIIRDFTHHKNARDYIKRRLALEKMLFKVSKKAISDSRPEDVFSNILRKSGMTLQLSHSCLYEYNQEEGVYHKRYDWHSDEVCTGHVIAETIKSEWLAETLRAGIILKYSSAEMKPDERIKNALQLKGTQALLIIPLVVDGKVWGFLSFQECERSRTWAREDMKVLAMLANIVVSLLERMSREKELRIKDRSIELSSIAVAYSDLNGYLTYVNPTFLRYWRFNAVQNVVGMNVNGIWAEMGELSQVIKALQSQGEWRGEMKAVRVDGTTFIAGVNANTITDDKGTPLCWQASIIDITDRKKWERDLIKAKEQAEESNRLKSAFLANMSHEIRTPMNGILGFLNVIRDVDLTASEQKEYIELVNRSGKRMLDTVNDIIEISKIEAGEVSVQKQPVYLDEILKYMHGFFSKEASEKELKLILDDNPDIFQLQINTDQVKFESILTNLIKNAIKFTDKGAVRFGAYVTEGMVNLYVRDTGCGIPEDQIEKIFKQFVQGDMGHSRRYEGSGLGLSISKAYTEMLGGKIWAESQPGIGSEFTFSHPYCPLPSVSRDVKESDTESDNDFLAGHKILIAEDDLTSYILLKTFLKRSGARLYHAETGHAAVEIVTNNPDISMVLMDIRMPGMCGIEATRLIKKLNRKIPVIAQTAYAFVDEKHEAMKAGCDDHISKPVDRRLLIQKMKKLLN